MMHSSARPVPGNPELLPEFLDDSVACLRRLYQTYGPLISFTKGRNNILFCFGPEYNQAILSDPDKFFRVGFLPGGRVSAQRRLATGLFNINGDDAKRHRRLLMPHFRKEIIDGYRDVIADVTQNVLDAWQPGQVHDVAREMKHLALRISSRVLFGLDDLQAGQRISDIFEGWLDMNSYAILQAALPVSGKPISYDRMLGEAAELESVLLKVIAARRVAGDGDDVLSLLIRTVAEDRLTDAELVGQAAHLFNAAYHTTSYALTWTLFLLAQHPAIMSAVLDEMDQVLHGRTPSATELHRLNLLERVLKESMRMLPPVVYFPRDSQTPVEVANVRWPAGTVFVASMYITHHMAELYPEPEKFLPDRWLTANRSGYEYLPFGAGPRMCIGGPISMMTMKTALSMTLQRFRLTVVPGTRIERRGTFTMGPREGIPMMVARQDRRFSTSEVVGTIHEMVDMPRPMALPTAA